MDLVCGIDGGKTNLAVAFMNRSTLVVETVFNIDLTIQYGHKLDFTGYEWMGSVIDRWVLKLEPWFVRCCRVGIERAYRGLAREFLHVVNAHLESSIRARYPHLQEFRIVDPKLVRAYFQTSGGDYAERKKKSVESPCISDADKERFKSHFKKQVYNKKTKSWSLKSKPDDAIEACEIALYLATHEDRPEHTTVKGYKTDASSAIQLCDVQMYAPAPREALPKRKTPKSPSSSSPRKRTKAQ